MKLLCIKKIRIDDPIWYRDPDTIMYLNNNYLKIDKIYDGEIDNSEYLPAYTINFDDGHRQTIPAECFIHMAELRQQQMDSVLKD